MEIRLLKNSCVNCYYYGKICGFGKGKVSALFFKKGDLSKFNEKKISWKDMIPDILVPIFPLIASIILLAYNFSMIILALIAVLLILPTVGNGMIRGSLTCNKCKQREYGCPTEKLFNENE